MVVHAFVKGARHAPCGYAYRKNLRGLDHSTEFSTMKPFHVTCDECRWSVRRPAKRADVPYVLQKKGVA